MSGAWAAKIPPKDRLLRRWALLGEMGRRFRAGLCLRRPLLRARDPCWRKVGQQMARARACNFIRGRDAYKSSLLRRRIHIKTETSATTGIIIKTKKTLKRNTHPTPQCLKINAKEIQEFYCARCIRIVYDAKINVSHSVITCFSFHHENCLTFLNQMIILDKLSDDARSLSGLW